MKDPRNYLKLIKSCPDFLELLSKEYAVASDLKKDILKIQKKMKNSNLRLNSIARQLNENSSQTSQSEEVDLIKTVVLEPDNLIFTISQTEIVNIYPDLVFEQKDSSGKTTPHYFYLNKSFKPFLTYL